MIRIVIIAALIIALMFLLNYYKRSSVEGRRKILKALLFSALGLALIALVVTGRLNWLVALVGSLVPLLPKFFSWLIRYAPSLMVLFKKYKLSGKGKSTKTVHGQQSQVDSVYLVMTLDHDTGGIDGKVIKGEFKGRLLSQMTLQELRKMLHDCDDDETISLLMTYMDRYNRRHSSHGDGYRDENNERPDFMSIHEAREILGVSEDAKRQVIIEAHRHLIQKLHPDRGGSEYLAMKINRAKDLLLGEV